MKIFDKVKNKINNKLKLFQSRVKGKRYTNLQKPVKDMSYDEVCKEFLKKEKIIFSQENNFEGRSFDLTKKYIFESKDNNFAISYMVKLLNNDDISKGVKLDFIHRFCGFFDDNELCKLLDLNPEKIKEQFKVQIVKESIDRVPEGLIIDYFDYTDINLGYLQKLLKSVSVDSKITILNKINDDGIKEALLLNEVNDLDFDDAKKMYEQVILYGYNEIEEFYIKKIKTLDYNQATSMLNEMSYISPNLAKAFDRVIKQKSVEEVIEYINNNNIKKGGIIYLNRKFSVKDKKKVFYNIKNKQTRKEALVIFTTDLGKKDFVNMVRIETENDIKLEMVNNANMFMRLKLFSEEEIEKLRNL